MTCVQVSVAAHAQLPQPDEAPCIMLHLQSHKLLLLPTADACSSAPGVMRYMTQF